MFRSSWSCSVITFSITGLLMAQAPQAPTGLTVVSATKNQVQLSWTPSDGTAVGYLVDRRPLDGSYGATTLSGTASTITDTTIDPYTTYVYRVRASSLLGQSAPSNEVTVGPPPYGFNLAVAPPSNVTFFNHFGVGLRMALDSNGDPALAYVFHDPNEDGDFSDSALYFLKWNRAAYQWTKPVKVALTGEVDDRAENALSIAFDASNNTFGIAFEDDTNPAPRISVALSTDNGATWKVQTAAMDSGDQTFQYQSPSLAMNGGNIYLVCYHDYEGLRYVTGKQTEDPKNWSAQVVPPLAGFSGMQRVTSLALDSAGVPGVAFVGIGDNGPAEGFWRPGSASSVLAIDDHGQQTDAPDVKLTFFGTQPRLVFAGAADENYFADYSHTIWVAGSSDGGATWSRAVNIPSDGNRTMDPPVSIASGLKGQVVVVTENNGGNTDGVSCGEPKLSRTNDLLTWTTCGLSTLYKPGFSAGFPVVLFGGNDKLWVSFQQANDGNDLPVGVTLWREPPDWVFPAPPPAE